MNHSNHTTTSATGFQPLRTGRSQLQRLLRQSSGPLTFQATAYRYGSALEVSLYHQGTWVDTFANSAGAALHELAQLVRGLRKQGISARVNLRIHPASMRFQGEGLTLADLPNLPF
jgi:hypothetical protein